ncbi:hypothetical protein IJU97_03820 [bacterium]|nr:hypothetical protein [bacterium]
MREAYNIGSDISDAELVNTVWKNVDERKYKFENATNNIKKLNNTDKNQLGINS